MYTRFEAVLKARDEWRLKEGSETVSVSAHSAFVNFILSARDQDKRLSGYPTVKHFLNVYTNSERHDLFGDIKNVINPISKDTERRMYRIITTVDDPESNGDKRLRGLILWIMSNNPHFSIYGLMEHMFTYIQKVTHSKPKENLVCGRPSRPQPLRK